MAPSALDSPSSEGQGSRSELDTNGSQLSQGIAIIGFDCNFPQDANTPSGFWRMMKERQNAMTEFPPSRLNIKSFHDPHRRPGPLPMRGGHFLSSDLGAFDAEFFSISPSEAPSMDPQQRLLLETTYRALENAGIPIEKVRGTRTSVTTGSFTNDYFTQALKDPEDLPTSIAIGATLSMLANRLSWFFDLKGPSMNMDSACASSAIAIQHACEQLEAGDCDLAIVAASNLILDPDFGVALGNMNFMSADSRSFAFDQRANGYGRGEGVGVILLQRVDDAIRDQNCIRAVIRAARSNQNGSTLGITQPSSTAQRDLIAETYRKAGLSMRHTRFFEAHGTGTILGDVAEANAIIDSFVPFRTAADPLYIGAVKSFIGHLEGASGIAGLIKVIMVLEAGRILPNANFELVNPQIYNLQACAVFPQRGFDWPDCQVRRASLNSFGYGGTNCHIVLDDALSYLRDRNLPGNHNTVAHRLPSTEYRLEACSWLNEHTVSAVPRTQHTLLMWSANNKNSLLAIIASWRDLAAEKLSTGGDSERLIVDIAYTLAARRSRLPYTATVVVQDLESLASLNDQDIPTQFSKISPSVAFIFTGQGAQWYAMGRELFQYRTFARHVANATEILFNEGSSWSAKDELLRSEVESQVDKPELAQPLTTIVQIGVILLLREAGVSPNAVVGHSMGEIAAAYTVGVFDAASAIKLAYYRGMFVASIPQRDDVVGGMLAVGLGLQDLQPYFERVQAPFMKYALQGSCVNSPSSTTVSGETAQLDELRYLLEADGVFARKLRVSAAYHSSQLQQIATDCLEHYNCIAFSKKPLVGVMISTVTGRPIQQSDLARKEYWVQNMISPVLFSQAISCLTQRSHPPQVRKLDGSHRKAVFVNVLLEVGPHGALALPIKQILESSPVPREIRYMSCLSRHRPADKTLLTALGSLWSLGLSVSMAHFNELKQSRVPSAGYDSKTRPAPQLLVDAPRYPFDHTRTFWHEGPISRHYKSKARGPILLLGQRMREWRSFRPEWRHQISSTHLPWLGDHIINGSILYPAAAMILTAVRAVREIMSSPESISGFLLSRIQFCSPVVITSLDSVLDTRCTLDRQQCETSSSTSPCTFSLYSLMKDEWQLAFSCDIEPQCEQTGDLGWRMESYQTDFQDDLVVCTEAVGAQDFYQALQRQGFGYRGSFQSITHAAYSNQGQAVGSVQLTLDEDQHDEIAACQPDHLQPGCLDSILQVMLLALSKGGSASLSGYVVTKIERLWLSAAAPKSRQSVANVSAKITSATARDCTGDIFALDLHSSKLLASIEGFSTTRVGSGQLSNCTTAPISSCLTVQAGADLSLASPATVLRFLDLHFGQDQAGPKALHRKVHGFVVRTLRDIETKVQSLEIPVTKMHMKRYLTWAKHSLTSVHSYGDSYDVPLPFEATDQSEEPIINMFSHVGRHGVQILRDDNAIETLFQSDLAGRFYASQSIGSRYYEKLVGWLQCASFINSEMHVLEIGGGTGSFTEHVLRGFCSPTKPNSLRLASYTFSDISASFFGEAREKFAWCDSYMRYQILDVERDASSQSLKDASYDLVVASNVLHLCDCPERSLRSIQKLLRPGGRLILHENTRPDKIESGFIFGLTQSWWPRTDQKRLMSPLMSLSTWDMTLKAAGFTGTGISIPDFVDETCHTMDIVISDKLDTDARESFPKTIRIFMDAVISQHLLADSLTSHIEKTAGWHCSIRKTLMSKVESEGKCEQEDLTVVLAEYNNQFLTQLTATELNTLRQILMGSRKLLWVVKAQQSPITDPRHGAVLGFFRAFNIEFPGKQIMVLELDPCGESDSQYQSATSNILAALRKLTSQSTLLEENYRVCDGIFRVNRLVQDPEATTQISSILSGLTTADMQLHKCRPFLVHLPDDDGKSHAWAGTDSEILSDLDLSQTVRSNLQVEVSHVCIDSRTSNQPLGLIPYAGLAQGKAVCFLADRGLRSTVLLPAAQLIQIPEEVSGFDAASSLAYCYLAIYAFQYVGAISTQDRLLLCAPRSFAKYAILTLASTICQHICVTAESFEEKQWIESAYGSDRLVVMHKNDIVSRYRRAAKHEGTASCVINIDGTLKSTDIGLCVEPSSRLVNCSFNSSAKFEAFPVNTAIYQLDRKVARQVAYDQVNVRNVQSLFGQTWSLRPPLPRVRQIDVSEIVTQSQSLRGIPIDETTVVRFPNDSILQFTKPTPVPTSSMLDCHDSYLIVGGFGGLGRCIMRWMAKRGARHLVVFSRQGPSTKCSRALVEELTGQGVAIHSIPCDVADSDSAGAAFKYCRDHLPRIRGCIQLSGCLKDILYSKMTFEDWAIATQPKIQGSWNLHLQLPPDLDFFILSSSISGVLGQATQTNYAAGNAFQDALAHFRSSIGMKTISLDLGLLLVGDMLAQTPDLLNRLMSNGHYEPVSEPQVEAIFDYHCKPHPKTSLPSAQLVIGIRELSHIVAEGHDLLDSLRRPFWSIVRSQSSSALAADNTVELHDNIPALLSQASTAQDMVEIILQKLIQRLSLILSTPEADFGPEQAVHTYGADSLTATDIHNWVLKRIGVDLPVFEILGDTSIKEMATIIGHMWRRNQALVD